MRKRVLIGVLLMLFGVLFPVLAQNQNVTVQYGIQIGPAHKATLTWTAPDSGTPTGYNVYRSNVSGSGYVKIGTTGASTLTYTDGGLPAGKTFFYVVSAVSGAQEGPVSNEVTAAVPNP